MCWTFVGFGIQSELSIALDRYAALEEKWRRGPPIPERPAHRGPEACGAVGAQQIDVRGGLARVVEDRQALRVVVTEYRRAGACATGLRTMAHGGED